MSGVSVVLPVRDGGAYFEPALCSLAAQTYSDFEVVIHDDGSTDGSLALAQSFARRDPRFVVLAGQARGVAHAANAAAAGARGDLLVRMDADDLARPTRLEALVALAAANPETELFGSRVRYTPREAVSPGMERYETWLNSCMSHAQIYAERFVEYPLPHPTTAIRRASFERLGGYRHGGFPEDYEFFLRAAAAGLRFAKHPDVLLDWREGEHRTTKNDPRYGFDRFHELKVAHVSAHLQASGRPISIVGAGRAGKRWARSLRGTALAVTAFLDEHPGRIGQTIQALPVLALAERPALDFLLCATADPADREALRARFAADGLTEDADYVFAV